MHDERPTRQRQAMARSRPGFMPRPADAPCLRCDVGHVAQVHHELPQQAKIVLESGAISRLRALSATILGLGLLCRRDRWFGPVSGDTSDIPSDCYGRVPARKMCSMWTCSGLLRWTLATEEHDILHMQVMPNKSAPPNSARTLWFHAGRRGRRVGEPNRSADE